MSNLTRRTSVLILPFVVLAALAGGCATAPKAEISKIFYPPAPEPPRLQYLTSLTGEKDIARRKSAFFEFVTGTGESKKRLDKPYGVALWNGKLYVCDTNRGVVVFDLEHRSYGELLGAHGTGQLTQPVNIRIAPDGMKYVSDPVRGQVVVFDKNDFYVTAFGMPGTWKPVDAVPYENELYVADMKNYEIVVLNRQDGSPVRRFGMSDDPAQRVARPTNLAFDDKGHLYVSDAGLFRIQKFDRDGHYLGSVGEIGREGGTFSRPKGVAVDRQDRLYVVDTAFANVQMFDKDGNLLFYFGEGGKRPGTLDLPCQVIVDYDNIRFFQQYADPKFDIDHLVVVVSQFGDRMINVFAMGKERGRRYMTDEEYRDELKEKLKKAAAEKAEAEKAAKEKAAAAKTGEPDQKDKPADKTGEPDKVKP